ncbi:6-pyruvoyl tetrahydropterin synthase [Paramagnetospirillum marisnigri]|uniref:6-carboxy-5,6,7,8-tetrahydropterin synthase n=1 Tax=Paramagnetospirillum marisnigri TaxID=1285242 RepID=A0A178MSE8_9PROT|nr:6-carboxytetrahydropterin synthase [Paramagnetospirillum marisnigri]OAN52310.1 6-pyruvoyl tetrahydropterin synthase [Paramagnetospirillum marisnigri]
MSSFRVRRRIEIDAGHRIMTHGSKCRNLHGHRYVVEVECEARRLHADGEQTDMVVDFGFLKDEMMRLIDAPCDHGFIAAAADAELLGLFAPVGAQAESWVGGIRAQVAADGAALTTDTRMLTKLYVVPFQPTAECLAMHWYGLLEQPVAARSDGCARLVAVRVWETPNCMAEYAPG